MASSISQFQTQIPGSGNDHRADSIAIWKGFVYLGGFFKMSGSTKMALKKFKLNLDVVYPSIEEQYTYVQQQTSGSLYSIDTLHVDHHNDRIIGLSVPRDAALEAMESDKYLLHIIYNDNF